ncbi:MAG: hypothetical protein GY788_27625 [bacterium]|nr:hypothetical protein [bacterium]
MLITRRHLVALGLPAALLWSGCAQQSERGQAAEQVFEQIEFDGTHEVEMEEATNSGILYDVAVDSSFTAADLTMPEGFVEGPIEDQIDFVGPDPVQSDLNCIVTVGIPTDLDVQGLVSFDVACGFHEATP